MDYTAEDITGKSMYSLCHAEDVDKIKKMHTDCKYIPATFNIYTDTNPKVWTTDTNKLIINISQ